MDDWEGSYTSGGGVQPIGKKKFSFGAQLSVVGVVVLTVGVFAAVMASQQSTENRSRASGYDQYGSGSNLITSGSVYRLLNECSGKALEVNAWSTANGGFVDQWSWTGGTNQQWKATSLGNGYYSLAAQHDGKFLDVAGVSNDNGAWIIQWGSSTPAINDQWKIVDVGNGYYKLLARNSGKALAIGASSLDNGAHAIQWDDNGLCDQHWRIESPSAPLPSVAPATPTPTAVVLPTATPLPTHGVFPTPTSFPTPIPTTVVPTSIPHPTNVPNASSTLLNLKLALHGIGKGGDNINPTGEGNTSPVHSQRTATVEIYNSQNQLMATENGTISLDSATGLFTGQVDLGSQAQTGTYTIKVKVPQYLRTLFPGIQTLTAGQATTLPQVSLVSGDINGDNSVSILDYNILMGCYSDLLPATNCTADNDIAADLTDDGHVNQFDYNFFLRELSAVQGQ